MALTEGSYTWNINEATLLNKIINAKNGESFESNIFEIGQLNWRIDITPNGMNVHNIDSFDVFLKLMKLPGSWKEMTICNTISSPQTHSSDTKMVRYTDGASRGWPAYSLTLKEIKESKLREIEIKISIKILEIRLIKNNEIYYHFKLNYDRKQQLIWKFDEETMNKLKLSNTGKMSSSNIYNEMWVIQVHPNGWHQKYEGKFIVTLELCALPSAVNKMEVERTVSVKQLNFKKAKKSQYSSKVTGKIMIPGSFQQFKECDEFEIVVDIVITKLYDIDGKEINDLISREWDKYIEKEQKQQSPEVSINSINQESVQNEINTKIQSMNDRITQILEEEKNNNILSEINELKQEIEKLKSTNNIDNKLNSLQTKMQQLLDINKENQQQIKLLMNINKEKEEKIKIINDKHDDMMIEINKLKQEIKILINKEGTDIMKKIKMGFAAVLAVGGVGYMVHHFFGKNKVTD